MSDRFLLEEAGDEEYGFSWDIKELRDGKLIHVGTFLDKKNAEEFLASRRWLDTMAEFKMGLVAEGLLTDGGVVKLAPKPRTRTVPVKPKAKKR